MKKEREISMGEVNMDGPKLTEINQPSPVPTPDRDGSVGVGENLIPSRVNNRGGNKPSRMQEPQLKENQDGGHAKTQLRLVEVGKGQSISASEEKENKRREEREEDFQYAGRMATDYGSFGIEAQKLLESFKIPVVGKDGKPVEKTVVDIGGDIYKEIAQAFRTGRLSDEARESIGLVDKLLEESDKSEAGKLFKKELYKSMGLGSEAVGKMAHKMLRNQLKAASRVEESGVVSEEFTKSALEEEGKRQVDVEDIARTMGFSEQEMIDLIKAAEQSIDQGTVAAAQIGGSNSEVGSVPLSGDGGKDGGEVASTVNSNGGNGDIVTAQIREGQGGGVGGGDVSTPAPLRDGGQPPSSTGGARGSDEAARAEIDWRNWYKNKYVAGTGIVTLMLLLLYLGAMGKMAEGLESIGERTRASTSSL